VGGLRHAADEEESRFPRLRVFSATDTHAELGRLRRRQGAGRRECFLHAQNSGPTQRELYAYPAFKTINRPCIQCRIRCERSATKRRLSFLPLPSNEFPSTA
jgi:hypothetical protein